MHRRDGGSSASGELFPIRTGRSRDGDGPVRDELARLLRLISTREITAQRQLRADAGLRMNVICKTLAELVREGLVEPDGGRGRAYVLTQLGREAVASA
jgi:predicted transcriptional regulator